MNKRLVSRRPFCEELRDILEEKKITYKELSKKSNVSISYLTKILVHRVSPSIGIIYDISKALDIDPHYFFEYNTGYAFFHIEMYYNFLKPEEIEILNNIATNLLFRAKKVLKNKNNKIDSKSFSPNYIIDIGFLNKSQRRTVNIIIDKFKDINKEFNKKDDELKKFKKREDLEEKLYQSCLEISEIDMKNDSSADKKLTALRNKVDFFRNKIEQLEKEELKIQI